MSGTFTGALGAGEKIQVSANGGTTWVDATVGPGSSWSASGVTLSAGTGTLLVQSIDTAGNATAGTGHSYTLQTSGPSAIATVTALSADTGASGSDFITNVASQTVSGAFHGCAGSGREDPGECQWRHHLGGRDGRPWVVVVGERGDAVSGRRYAVGTQH